MVADLRFARAETPLGPMLLAATADGVAALSRSVELGSFIGGLGRRFPDVQPVADAEGLQSMTEWLRGYLRGARHDLAPVDLGGIGRWDGHVYRAVRSIPYGQTATYGEIALAIGSPGAARAVGGALSRCPLLPAVPCHRVVLAGDGVSGWGGGDIEIKRFLLALERRRAR